MPPLTTLSAVLYINIWCIAVLLDAPDTVLIERANGKRIDPETGGIVLLLLFALVKCCGVYAAGVIILFVLIECLPPDFQLFKNAKSSALCSVPYYLILQITAWKDRKTSLPLGKIWVYIFTFIHPTIGL